MPDESASYFTTPSLNGLIQQLHHLCQFGADALVVQGEQGAGKTTLLAHFSEQLQIKASQEIPLTVSSLVSLSSGDAHDVLLALVRSLGLDWESASSGELMSRLRSFVQALLREKQLAIVLIDDAEKLDAEALGALLSLLQNDSDVAFGLKFVFFSEPGFAQRVDDVGLVELAVYDFDMPRFSPAELDRFLSECCPEVEEARANESALSANTLWTRSGGLPGKALSIINQLTASDRANLAKDIKKMPVLHLVVVAVLIAGLLLTVFYRGDKEHATPEAELLSTNSLLKPESNVSSNADLNRTVLPDGQTISVESESVSEPDMAASQAHDSVSILDATFDKKTQQNLESEKAGNDVLQTEVREESRPAGDSESPDVDKNEEEQKSYPEEEKATTARLSDEEKKLLAYGDSAYVLQMLAATQKGNLEQFIAAQSNADMLAIYRKRRNQGGTWYVVVSGPFVTKSEAQRAILNLPASQRRSGPWPKSMASVKAEIRDYHGLRAP